MEQKQIQEQDVSKVSRCNGLIGDRSKSEIVVNVKKQQHD